MIDRSHRHDPAERHGGLFLLLGLAACALIFQAIFVPRAALAARPRRAGLAGPERAGPAPATPTTFLTREVARQVVTGGREPGEATAPVVEPGHRKDPSGERFTWAGKRREAAATASTRTARSPESNAAVQTAREVVRTAEPRAATIVTTPAVTDTLSSGTATPEEGKAEWLVATPGRSEAKPASEGAGEGDADDSEEPPAADEAMPDPVDPLPADPDATTPMLSLLGESLIRSGESLTLIVTMEAARDLAHAPLRLSWNPDVLEFQEAREGAFLSSDGASTQFLAVPDPEPGAVDIVLSRMPPAGGLAGNGTLCEIVLRAHAEGESPVVLSGSRLLDVRGKNLRFRRSETHVAVN